MKKFFEFLREHAQNIINFKKKKNEVIHKRAVETDENAKICYICKENFGTKYVKVRDHCRYVRASHIQVLRIAYVT